MPPVDTPVDQGSSTECRFFPACAASRRTAPVMHCRNVVNGAITGRDVLVHSVTIVRLFGPAFYVRCLRAMLSGRPCTFLEVLAERR